MAGAAYPYAPPKPNSLLNDPHVCLSGTSVETAASLGLTRSQAEPIRSDGRKSSERLHTYFPAQCRKNEPFRRANPGRREASPPPARGKQFLPQGRLGGELRA